MKAPHHDFEAFVTKALARVPPSISRFISWLRHPARRWIRIPAALLLLAGGVLWFLPLVGFWMLPLGLILLAEDFPPLKRRLGKAAARLEAWWKKKRA